jgi:diguanylate cyclase (GGDEF)-like protein
MGYFIVVLLRRRNLFRKLETISYSDQLTGFGNRHAMDCFMESLQPSKSIGVVYCDVTGLKRVNDTSGHREGDALLLRACECLKEVFEGYAMFRLGGDEFLVICSGISETELYEKEAALKDKMKKYSCILAVGCVWHQNSEENMDRLLMEADQRMYEDKRKHYEEMNMQS